MMEDEERLSIGFTNAQFEVFVRKNDNNIPHVHIKKREDKNYFETCVRLDRCAYLPHGTYSGMMDKDKVEDFKSFMELVNDDGSPNYDLAVEIWNEANPNSPLKAGDIPDYSKLEAI